MPAKTISPLSGFPSTTQYINAQGQKEFKVAAWAPTPSCVRARDALLSCWAVVLVVYGLLVAARCNFDLVPIAVIAAAGGLAYGTVWVVLNAALRIYFNVRLTQDRVITNPFPFWSRHYDRKEGCGFALAPHDLMLQEQRAHELAQAEAAHRGKVLRKKPIYGDSYVVIYWNGSQRVDIAVIYGVKAASAVVTRLQHLDHLLDHELRTGASSQGGHMAAEPGGL